MARRGNLYLAAALAVGVVAVTPACASPYTVTYTGTVVGTDTDGVFAAAGTALSSYATQPFSPFLLRRPTAKAISPISVSIFTWKRTA